MERKRIPGKNGGRLFKPLLVVFLLIMLVALVLSVLHNRAYIVQTATPSPAPTAVPGGKTLDVWFIDVGQGDSILLRSPNGKWMLVDAGPRDSFAAIDGLLKSLSVRTLDIVVATHVHEDHIGGMAALAGKYKIGKFYTSSDTAETNAYADMLAALKKAGVKPEIVYATATSMLPFDADVEVRLLSPFDAKYDESNDKSVVLRIAYGATSVLLAGDAEAIAERLMLKALPNVLFDSDVLKLGHHGSYSSTTEKFLLAVSPSFAVASCAKDNIYGYPDEKIVELLHKHGVPLLTTADSGTIHIALDGATVKVVE